MERFVRGTAYACVCNSCVSWMQPTTFSVRCRCWTYRRSSRRATTRAEKELPSLRCGRPTPSPTSTSDSCSTVCRHFAILARRGPELASRWRLCRCRSTEHPILTTLTRSIQTTTNIFSSRFMPATYITLSPNSTWLDTTRHVRRVQPMHFGCVELVEQHRSTCSSRSARHVDRVMLCGDVTSQVEFGVLRSTSLYV